MRALGTIELETLRQKIFRMADTVEYGFLPPSAFLPDQLIKEIINKLYTLKTIDDIQFLVQGNQLLDNWQAELLEFCERLQKIFAEYREEIKQKRIEKKKEQAQEIQVDDDDQPMAEYESGTDEEDIVINNIITNVDMGEVEELQMQHLQDERQRITWRINMRYIIHSFPQLEISNGCSVMQQLESLNRHVLVLSSPLEYSTSEGMPSRWDIQLSTSSADASTDARMNSPSTTSPITRGSGSGIRLTSSCPSSSPEGHSSSNSCGCDCMDN